MADVDRVVEEAGTGSLPSPGGAAASEREPQRAPGRFLVEEESAGSGGSRTPSSLGWLDRIRRRRVLIAIGALLILGNGALIAWLTATGDEDSTPADGTALAATTVAPATTAVTTTVAPATTAVTTTVAPATTAVTTTVAPATTAVTTTVAPATTAVTTTVAPATTAPVVTQAAEPVLPWPDEAGPLRVVEVQGISHVQGVAESTAVVTLLTERAAELTSPSRVAVQTVLGEVEEGTEPATYIVADTVRFTEGVVDEPGNAGVYDRLAELLVGEPGAEITITGFGDDAERTEANHDLGHDRTGHAAEQLVERGVDAERIRTVGLWTPAPPAVDGNDGPNHLLLVIDGLLG